MALGSTNVHKIGKCKQRGFLSVCCSAAAAAAAGNLFDETPATKNGNGSVPPMATLGIDAEITTDIVDFFDDEDDPDHPSEGYSSIQTAVDAIRQGKVPKMFLFLVDNTFLHTCTCVFIC